MKQHPSDRRRPALPVRMSRRRCLKALGAAAMGAFAAGCMSRLGAGQAVSTPSASPVPITAVPTAAPAARVAIAQAASYDRELVRKQVRALIDGIGGLDDLIRARPRVAIKVNLTGGTNSRPVPGVTPIESFVTHPEVVRALGAALREAGARELYIVEAVYERASYSQWGYDEVAQALDATLIDLNDPHPYSAFTTAPVGQGWSIYQEFVLHPLLQEIDTFISVAKIKCHMIAGVTLSMKNLFGLAPLQHYRLDTKDTYRSAFHGAEDETGTRVPRIIIDLNRVRPIHLSLLDGIKTVEGGEGPWIESMAPLASGVLIAGRNPVATDAIATAVMGFDPRGSFPASPFLHGDNHLSLAADAGIGTNRLDAIEVVGARLEEVRHKFKPAA